jgi:hypothetical protein
MGTRGDYFDVVLISGTIIEGGKSSQGSRPFAGRASLKRG